MAKQKRLNKNLVAFLTTMGMVVIVSVAGLMIWAAAQRDPAVLGEQARTMEQKGTPEELAKAIQFYQQAYAATGDTEGQYILDMSRCLFKMGGLAGWMNALRTANSKEPTEPVYLVTMLEGLWRLREIEGRGFWWNEWRDVSEKLLELDPDHPLGLVCKAHALWQSSEVGSDEEAAELATRAYELAPDDPRVALTYAEHLQRAMIEDLRRMSAEAAPTDEIRERQRTGRLAAFDVLKKAVEAGRSAEWLSPQLAMEFVTAAQADAGIALRNDERERGRALLEECRDTLNFALTEVTDETAAIEQQLAGLTPASEEVGPLWERRFELEQYPPELHLALGRHLRVMQELLASELTPEEVDALLAGVAEHVEASIKLDAAMYDAYTLKAQLKLLGESPTELSVTPEQYEAALRVYEEAAGATLTLRNLRAVLTEGGRRGMLHRAFATALHYAETHPEVGADDDKPHPGMVWAEQFLADVQTLWPEHPLTDYMGGRFAVENNDRVKAAQLFEQAQNKQPAARWWVEIANVDRLPFERLAFLYDEMGQLGEVERCATTAVAQYEAVLGRRPPARLLLLLVDVFVRLDKPRDALRLVDQALRLYEGDRALQAARATVLTRLGRTEEARAAAEAVVGEDATIPGLLWKARQAMERGDYDAADEVARGVLSDPEATTAQLRVALETCVGALEQSGRKAEAQALVRSLKDDPRAAPLEDMIQAYDILLADADAQTRMKRIEELIAAEPDPLVRAERFFNLYSTQGEPEKALPPLQELRRDDPENLRLMAREFDLRLVLAEQARQNDDAAAVDRHYAAATELVVPLSEADGGAGFDHVGGATFRGRLALSRGDYALAIRELRDALQDLPKDSGLHASLGRAYLLAGRTLEGVEALNRALDLNPRHVEAHGMLVQAYDQLTEDSFGDERERYRDAATEQFEKLAALAPNHSFVQRRRERAMEDADPLAAIAKRQAEREESPRNTANLQRLGELYAQAYQRARSTQDTRAMENIVADATAFFNETALGADAVSPVLMAQSAANFFAVSEQHEAGEKLLRQFCADSEGSANVIGHVLLARFLETQGDAVGAERAYQAGQAAVRQEISDPAERQRLETELGRAFIGFYERQGRPAQTVEVCRWLMDRLDEDSPVRDELRLQLAGALIRTGRFDEATRQLSEYREKHGDDVPGLVARARMRMTQGEAGLALDDLAKVIQLDPQNSWALMARGYLSLQRAEYDTALESLMAAERILTPGAGWETQLRDLLATVYERVGRIDAAIAERQEHLRLQEAETGIDGAVTEIVNQIVRLYTSEGRYDEAQRLVSEYMEKAPRNPDWPYRLGRILEQRADDEKESGNLTAAAADYEAAISYFQRSAERAGRTNQGAAVQAMTARMMVMVKAGKPRDALRYYDSLPFDRMPPGLRLAAGQAKWALNDRSAAVEQWEQTIVDSVGGGSRVIAAVVNDLRTLLQPADVQDLLARAAENVPMSSVGGQALRLAMVEQHALQEQYDEGRELLKELEEVTAERSQERLATHLTRGQLEERAGNPTAAAEAYRAALSLDQNSVIALNNLAYLLVKAEAPGFPRPEEALKYAERLEGMLRGEQAAANVLDTIGWVYYQYALTNAERRREYLDRAAASLQRALSLGELASPSTYEHLGQVYVALGRQTDARAVLQDGRNVARAADDDELAQRIDALLQDLQ